MQTNKLPYELLIRYDLTGWPSGAHVQHRYVIREDDGTVIGDTVGGAEPLTLETAAGFPLGDLLTQVQADALTAKAAADADRDAALVRVADLEAQVAALRPAAE
ncbi:hypothetical protein [Azospirillum palustre]